MHFVIDRAKWRCGDNLFPIPNFGVSLTLDGLLRDDPELASACANAIKVRHGKGMTLLLNNEGCMCCLGFMSLQCGLTKEAILGQALPQDIDDYKTNDVFRELFLTTNDLGRTFNQPWVEDLVCINDNHLMTDEERETELSYELVKLGHTVEFINDYPVEIVD